MLKFILHIGTAILFLGSANPAAAMMGGSGGGMWGMARELFQSQPERTQPAGQGHYHGDYYHVHEGGAVPHDHQSIPPTGQNPATPEAARKPAPAARIEPNKGAAPAGETKKAAPARKIKSETIRGATAASKADPLPRAVQWSDDVMLHRVPAKSPAAAGATKASEGADRTSFYMDETPVTNHQYVDFLNSILPRLRVEQNVVRSDGRIWLLLGEVKPGYEPIVFDGKTFQVNDAPFAASAVLRVSADGAAAYAAHYGKRLPTQEEWLAAAEEDPARTTSPAAANNRLPPAVLLDPPNPHGLRGMETGIGEWAVKQTAPGTHKTAEPGYVIMGSKGARTQKQPQKGQGLARYPWEAFADVGFRTVISPAAVRSGLPSRVKEQAEPRPPDR